MYSLAVWWVGVKMSLVVPQTQAVKQDLEEAVSNFVVI